MMQHIRPALVMMVLFTLLLGLGYPLAMTGVAGVLFPSQAGGSLIKDPAGHVIGSSLIAQAFAKPEYLHPRPSAAGNGYDPMSSGGSNLGPLDKKLIDQVKTNADAIRKDDGAGDIPADAVTNSGSGLDPDISPAYAHLQAARIAKARGRSLSEVLAVVDNQTDGPLMGFIGQAHVNVLQVNRALDARYPLGQPRAG
jgi:K+-transporting ATPase ATPase C chain